MQCWNAAYGFWSPADLFSLKHENENSKHFVARPWCMMVAGKYSQTSFVKVSALQRTSGPLLTSCWRHTYERVRDRRAPPAPPACCCVQIQRTHFIPWTTKFPVGSIPDFPCGNSWLLVTAGWKQVWSVACVCPLASTSHFIGFNKAQRVNSWSQTCADCCLFRFTFVPHTKKSAFSLFVRSLELTFSLCHRAHFLDLCTFFGIWIHFCTFWETLFWI